MTRKIGILLLLILALIALGKFFAFRILQSPLGLTADEGAFGINSVLLANTGHDENGEKMPLFVMSLDGNDWRQPVHQYYMALFFKLFGSNMFNLRFSSVVLTLISTSLLFALAAKMWNIKWAVVASFIFLTTPLIMIHSHMGLDNIMPVPFTLLWLGCMYLYSASKNKVFLLLAGAFLGISFYTYKGMRATASTWLLLSALYLGWEVTRNRSIKTIKSILLAVVVLVVGAAPFYLTIPRWERLYPGAIFDEQTFSAGSVYEFLNPYISSYDISFLFITGDATPWHSTGRHGMLLLASAPLFFLGAIEAVRKKKFWLLILWAFFTAPLLYGLVNSIHRASRLMAIIPLYAIICALGAQWLWAKKKILLIVIVGLMLVNYTDFTHFYWYKYPELTRQWFGDLSFYKDFETFAKYYRSHDVVPYAEYKAVGKNGITGTFVETAYFNNDVRYIDDDESNLGPGTVLLSTRDNVPGMTKLDLPSVKYTIHVGQ